MAYERSEPIAESFGESDVKIDYRLVDYMDENKSEDGWSGFHRIERIMWQPGPALEILMGLWFQFLC